MLDDLVDLLLRRLVEIEVRARDLRQLRDRLVAGAELAHASEEHVGEAREVGCDCARRDHRLARPADVVRDADLGERVIVAAAKVRDSAAEIAQAAGHRAGCGGASAVATDLIHGRDLHVGVAQLRKDAIDLIRHCVLIGVDLPVKPKQAPVEHPGARIASLCIRKSINQLTRRKRIEIALANAIDVRRQVFERFLDRRPL